MIIKLSRDIHPTGHENEGQWSIIDCWSSILGKLHCVRLQILMNVVMSATVCCRERDMLTAEAWNWVSTECEWLRVIDHCYLFCDLATPAKNISIRVEWLHQSERAPSEPSESAQCQITLHPGSIPGVALYISFRSRCNFSSHSFNVKLEECRNMVGRYDTTRPWGCMQLREFTNSRKLLAIWNVGIDQVCIFVVWQAEMKMNCCLSTLGSPEYILRVAHALSVTPVSLYAHRRSLPIFLDSVLDLIWRWTWSPRSSELSNALGGWVGVNWEMNLEVVIDWVWRCTVRTRWTELRVGLGGGDRASLDMHLQAMIEWYWRSTWRQSICREVRRPLRLYSLVNMWLWECKELSTTSAERWETGWEPGTVDLGMMLHLVYTVLAVNSSLWHGEIERDDLTWCSSVIGEFSTWKREIRRDRGNHHEKLGRREFCVRVNCPSLIRQVRVPIWRIITPIRGYLNPIMQVVILISHSCSYAPYRSYHHPPSLSYSSTTLPSSQ